MKTICVTVGNTLFVLLLRMSFLTFMMPGSARALTNPAITGNLIGIHFNAGVFAENKVFKSHIYNIYAHPALINAGIYGIRL